MFKKIGKRSGSGTQGDASKHRCVLCTRSMEDEDGLEWLMLARGNGEKAYICADCAYRTYEVVDNILQAYGELAIAASSASGTQEGASGEDVWDTQTSTLFTENHAEETEKAEKAEGREVCTPQSVFDRLGRSVVGQDHVKKVIAVAIYNHWRRMKTKPDGGPSIKKSNILLIGPTGTGKTLLAETAASILDVPFVSMDATSLSETGYKGDDVETAIERLVEAADGDVERAEHGIVCIDEIDKLAARGLNGHSVGAEGVQQALLKLIEGTTVTLERRRNAPGTGMKMVDRYQVDTSDILFICGGAFVGLQEDIKKRPGKTAIGFATAAGKKASPEKPDMDGITNADLEKYGIIPELAGRLPVKAVLEPLNKEDLVRILTEPEDAIMGQYQAMLAADGVEFSYTKEALERIAERAIKEKAGARGLKSVMDGIMLETMFRAPGMEGRSSLMLTADDVDGVTRPEDRLAEKPVENAGDHAGREDSGVRKDKKTRPACPAGNIRKGEAEHDKYRTFA